MFYKIRLLQHGGLEFYSTKITDKFEAVIRFGEMENWPRHMIGEQFCQIELIEFIRLENGYEHHNGVVMYKQY